MYSTSRACVAISLATSLAQPPSRREALCLRQRSCAPCAGAGWAARPSAARAHRPPSASWAAHLVRVRVRVRG